MGPVLRLSFRVEVLAVELAGGLFYRDKMAFLFSLLLVGGRPVWVVFCLLRFSRPIEFRAIFWQLVSVPFLVGNLG